MAVDVLQHINIHAADVERSKDFYVRVLGLQVGPRPPVASFGYWLYLGGEPVIHLVRRAPDSRPAAGSGAIDHVAFRGVNLAATRDVLHEEGVTYREAVIPRDGTVQLFFSDPDGITIELNFRPCPP
jgi:catechol 2,3-dioxygenase-like lactoylglutathione lyase family enzyme